MSCQKLPCNQISPHVLIYLPLIFPPLFATSTVACIVSLPYLCLHYQFCIASQESMAMFGILLLLGSPTWLLPHFMRGNNTQNQRAA